LIAVVNDQGQIYLGWRLLEDDPADVAFNVYRRTDGGSPIRVNPKPMATSTNLIDMAAPTHKANRRLPFAVKARTGCTFTTSTVTVAKSRSGRS
jgi:hypothetical protein